MHHELLQKATKEQLVDFLTEELDELKTSDREMYDELESELKVLQKTESTKERLEELLPEAPLIA